MAESQIIYDYTDCASHLELSLSKDRFAPYLVKSGRNLTYAFSLYLYNARLSKALLYPLHILEISLRNRINEILRSDFCENWPNDVSFRGVLNKESILSLDSAIDRAKTYKTADIVSTLSFDFWSNLFRPEYDRPLWQANMPNLLPNISMSRKEFQDKIKEVNKLRNRIAHYEPIHTMDISKHHTDILEIIGWLCSDTKNWVKHHSTVNSTIRTAPSANGEPKPHFCERCDTDFNVINETTTLDKFPRAKFILVVSAIGEVISIIEDMHLTEFLRRQIYKDGKSLMVDLSDFAVADLLSELKIPPNVVCCGGTESLFKARNLLKKKIKYIIVKDATGVIGVIAKAHREY